MDNTKNSIINLTEYGIDPSTIAGFLNERLYTDCHSLLLYNVNGKKAMAIRVEREFTPDMDVYFCTNNIEQYRAPIKLTGEPFEVEQHRGSWGKWCIDRVLGWWLTEEQKKTTQLVEGTIWHQVGEWWCIVRPTKTGKLPKKFHKYGQIEEHCGQFHDYNF